MENAEKNIAFGALSLICRTKECDGCGECTKACIDALSLPERHSAIQLFEIEGSYTNVLCRNCHDAPCVTACMPGCRYKDEESGRVVTDYQRCVGCWMCVMVCPFGAIQRLPAEEGRHHGKALKCDGCIGIEKPPCVAVCTNEALREIEPAKLAVERRTEAAVTIGLACFDEVTEDAVNHQDRRRNR